MIEQRPIPTSDVHPVEEQVSPSEQADGWQRGLTVPGVGCTHTVLVDDQFTKAMRVSTPDGMPGPAAFAAWKDTPRTVHIYEFTPGNEMESQMAFDRWVVEYAHDEMRKECR